MVIDNGCGYHKKRAFSGTYCIRTIRAAVRKPFASHAHTTCIAATQVEGFSRPCDAMTRPVEEDVHFRVLRILEQDPEISQRELAAKLGIALGRTNYVLNALLEKGLIKLGKFSAARDKRRYAYVLTPKGMARKAAITRRFLARKITEYEALKAEIETLQDELDGESRHNL